MYNYEKDFGIDASHSDKDIRPIRWYRRWWGKGIIGLFSFCLIITLAFGFYVFNLARQIRKGNTSVLGSIVSNNSQSLPVQEPESELTSSAHPYIGAENPLVTIYEFIDYECPSCKEAETVINQLFSEKKIRENAQVVYYHFPIIQLHPNALKAALAAQCAYKQGKFEAMHKKLLENQENLSVPNLKLYSIQLDLDTVQFSQCLDSNEYGANINKDFNTGVSLGVSTAPTFFIGEKKIEGVPNIFDLKQRIDILLSEKREVQ